jgi:hypothetical protein
MKTINRESGVEAGGAWRFRPQDAAITIRTAAKYPSDGGFHPRRPMSQEPADVACATRPQARGEAHAISPDAPCATNPLRGSVPACPSIAPCQLALGILPSLAAKAGSIGMGLAPRSPVVRWNAASRVITAEFRCPPQPVS